MLPLDHADHATTDDSLEHSGTQPTAVLPPPVAVPQPPVCSTESPVASVGSTSVSAEAMPSRESTRGRVGRKPTTRSPAVELVKIVVGGVAGLALAYCLLRFGFQIDILERLAGSKPAGAREVAGRPAEPRTSVANETKADAAQRAEGRSASPDLAASEEPAAAATTPDGGRDAPTADLIQPPTDRSSPAESSVGAVGQERGETTAPGLAASGVAPDTGDGQDAEPALASVRPADASSQGPAATPAEATGPSGTPTPDATVRVAVPAKDEQGRAAEQLREIFKRQYADATTPEGQLALAALLRNEASKLGDDPVAKFVMLKEAYDNALGGGDYGMAEDAARELCAAFDVDLNNVVVHLLSTAAKAARTNEARQDIAVKAVKFIEAFTAIERFDDALALAAAAESLAGRLRDTELRRQIASARDNAKTKKQAWEVMQKASECLKTDPDDPAANLIMGKHLCWTKDDWTHGLPMIAKGSDPELAAAAGMDLAGAAEAAKQVEVGDAWWALAENKQGEERNAMMLRAGFWYRQAEPNVQAGLDRLKVTQRLAEIGKAMKPIAEAAGRLFLSDLEPSQVILHPTMTIGEAHAVENIRPAHGLFAHPPASSFSSIAYNVPKGYRELTGTAAIADLPRDPDGQVATGSRTPLTFQVIGDGRILWKSRPLQRSRDKQPFSVDVSGVGKLELRVGCPGFANHAWAIWVDPMLRTAGEKPGSESLVCEWQRFVDQKVWPTPLYSNGRIGSPTAQAVWLQRGRVLFMLWPTGEPPGFVFDTAVLSPDGTTYSALNSLGGPSHGKLLRGANLMERPFSGAEAPDARLAAITRDFDELLGRWSVTNTKTNQRSEWTFNDDGTVSPAPPGKTNVWWLESDCVRIRWYSGLWDTFHRPLNALGTRGDSHAGKGTISARKIED